MRFRALRPFCVWGQQRGPEVDRLKEAKVDLRKMALKGSKRGRWHGFEDGWG